MFLLSSGSIAAPFTANLPDDSMFKYLACLFLSLSAFSANLAAQVLDVEQPSHSIALALFSQTDLAQSFIPSKTNCAGGSIFLSPGFGVGGTITVELWDALPNVPGANMLASGSTAGVPDSWAEAFWPGVPVTPGATYYMVYQSTDLGLGIGGEITNPYLDGILYANAGFGAFSTFDYAFRVWADGTPLGLSITGTCPTSVTISVVGATPNGSIALAYGGSTGTFTLPPGTCAGLVLDMNNPILAGFFTADAAGALNITTPIPAGICGSTLQAVDLTACVATNTVIL